MIPEDVARQARYPSTTGREPDPESGAKRVLRDAFTVLMMPMPTVTFVEDLRFAPEDVGAAIDDVRGLLRQHGRAQSAWVVSDTAPELGEALRHAGLTPYTDPPLGPRSTAMALVRPPDGEPGVGVSVRQAVELEDFVAVGRLSAKVFGMTAEDEEALVASLVSRHSMVQQGRGRMQTYLALNEDGTLVGEAQSSESDIGTNLSGSAVLPEARGLGVYRALVVARWERAVERGLPALTVQAGDMSRPVLAKLGFEVVDEMTLLCDRF